MLDEEGLRARVHQDLRNARAALLVTLDGLPDADVRRPLTPTGTNLLGLVKHCATWEARYLGDVLGRPCPEPLPAWDDEAAQGTDHWATEHETRADVLALYERVCAHADATIEALPLDAPGRVPWWGDGGADVVLLGVVVHVIGDTRQHAGHADVLREQLDGTVGPPRHRSTIADDQAFWDARWAEVDRAARTAETGPARR